MNRVGLNDPSNQNLGGRPLENTEDEGLGRYVGHRPFVMKQPNTCAGCGQVINVGETAQFRRWNGRGQKAEIVHVHHVHMTRSMEDINVIH